MPVLVTSASQPLASRVVHRLLQEGGEVRAYGSGDLSGLRAAGAIVASGTTDDEGRLEAALADVHTVVHVGAGLFTNDPGRSVTAAQVLATAAGNAGVRRVIALSLPGASDDADEPLRRAKAEVEAALATGSSPSVVVRVSLLDTPALRDALATAGLPVAVHGTEIAPVRVEDVLELLVAFDRARSSAERGHLVVAADGPTRMSVARYLERVGVAGPGRGSLVGRRLFAPERAPLLAGALLDGPWWSEEPELLDGWSFAELAPRTPGP